MGLVYGYEMNAFWSKGGREVLMQRKTWLVCFTSKWEEEEDDDERKKGVALAFNNVTVRPF